MYIHKEVDQLEQALAGPGSVPERYAAVTRAYVRFALEEQTCYRLLFDFARPEGEAAPELADAEQRAGAAMTDPVRLMADHGNYKGDPKLIGDVVWASLHGLLALHLAGKLESDFGAVLGEMSRALKDAYRVRTPA